MVVQTIQISFSSYAADTIRIHTGETGREILFAPDMEISGNYSADFIIIKPDDTFSIAAATITEGKINVEIPEQAGAVAGAGHYILKIYDSGETCIYSASGGFMVDDHLLSDGMIESVAEAYGYRFPQDFAVIDDNMIVTDKTWSSEKIAGMIDDDNILYDKTWSSDKIEREIGSAPGFHVYATTEQPFGRWIDGSMVYEKTYEITINCPANTRTDILSLTNENIIFIEGRAYYPSNSMWYMSPYDMNINQNNNNKMIICTHQSGGHPVITLVNGGFSNAFNKVQFTIRYTKNE